jgi:hypothetical protein
VPPVEDGDQQPITRAEADQAYRRLRAALLLPLFLRYYRRELDRRVRASEAALGGQ